MAEEAITQQISAALVIDQLTFDRLGPIIGHLSVGLLEYAGEIILITPADDAQRLALGPVRVIQHPRLRWPTRERVIRRILEDLGPRPPSVIHAITSRSFGLADELALQTGRPFLGHLLGSEDLQPAAQATIQRMDRVIAASEPLLQAARDRHIIDDKKFLLIRPGLLPEPAPTCFASEDRIPTILCMSALESANAIDRLILAIKILVGESHDLMLFLVADGPAEKKLRKLVEAEGLIKQVTFGQFSRNWPQVMRAADIFVVPSSIDRVDLRLLHALAAGVAAVVGEMPNSDFVMHERTALVCSDSSPQELAAAIRRLLTERAFARQLASRALQHCKTFHSLSEMTKKTGEVYAELSPLRIR